MSAFPRDPQRFSERPASLPTRIADIVQEHFDLRPASMLTELSLLRPIYRQTAAFGQFGRTDVDLPWEHTHHADALRAAAGTAPPGGEIGA